jgi:hypothetical protein
VPNGFGTGELTEWSSIAWTDGELPRTVFWDDFTGHIYFTLGLGHRVIKWHPDSGYAGHCDDVAIPAGWGIQSDFNIRSTGSYWATADYDATLVNLCDEGGAPDRFDPVLPPHSSHLAALTKNSRIPPSS